MKIENPLIGADAEVFLMHKKSGKIISAEGFIHGTKHDPFCFDKSNKFFMTSLDNVLAEFGIPPVNDREAWIKNIQKSLNYVASIVPHSVCVAAMPSARLADRWLRTENAKLFGCEPDFCVWTKSANEKPQADYNLRSSGFHVHVGYDNFNIPVTEELVKAMDLYLGVPSVLIEPPNERRALYGKAGCFRPKDDYGMEYRTLSGYFSSTPELSGWVFDNTQKAIKFVNDDRVEEAEAAGELIQEAINTGNKVIAGNLIRQFEIEMV